MQTQDSNKIHGPAAFVLGRSKMLEDTGQSDRPLTMIVGPPYLPEDTEIPISYMDFIIGGAGIGDLICHFPAFIWMAKNCPWIRGNIVCPRELRPFARNVMHIYRSTWNIHGSDKIKHRPGSIVCAPGYKINGEIKNPFCNGTGGHLVHASFINFANIFPPPPGADEYPVVNLRKVKPSLVASALKSNHKYIVFTTGAVSKAREVKGYLWSPIVHHIKRMGYLPVFLGKTKISDTTITVFPDGCPYEEGLDLRDQTTILEAMYIMKHASAVLGLDNGLIQMASCTDASIIAAYNIVKPEQRVPNRKKGKFIALSLTKEELACSSCQAILTRLHPSHSFTRCLMGDTKCIDLLFQNNGVRWKSALDQILR